MTLRERFEHHNVENVPLSYPRRIRRKKDPVPFNVLVVGSKNCGKTSFINFLCSTLSVTGPPNFHKTKLLPVSTDPTGSPFTPYYFESEIDNERIGVTIWDSVGLEKNIVDLQLREILSFIESKFEETFNEEQKVFRAPGSSDTQIHCVFLLLDPMRISNGLFSRKTSSMAPFPPDCSLSSNGNFLPYASQLQHHCGLDKDLDVEVMKTFKGKATLFPLICKADTITTPHMLLLKQMVWHAIQKAKLDPLEALELADIEENDVETSLGCELLDSTDHSHIGFSSRPYCDSGDEDEISPDINLAVQDLRSGRISEKCSLNIFGDFKSLDVPFLPMAIMSPDPLLVGSVGRAFPWGFADPFNPQHSDFVKLRDCIFREWRSELRDVSRKVWYEKWRTSRLKCMKTECL